MNEVTTLVTTLLATIPAKIVVVLGVLSGIDKALEMLALGLTGKPQAAVKEADGMVEAVIGVLQKVSNWLAPRTSATAEAPASTTPSK